MAVIACLRKFRVFALKDEASGQKLLENAGAVFFNLQQRALQGCNLPLSL